MQNDPLTSRRPRPLEIALVFLAAFCFLDLSFPALSSAAELPPQKENRFLFVINTSSGMRRFTNGIQEAVVGLLRSGMKGQMRDGDTFGIWNYDDQLHTDFPMQIWSKSREDDIVGKANSFLDGRHYQKRPHLEKVMPALSQVVENSTVVTLIFISDGSETMQGTGFDKDINDLHKEFGHQMRADEIPFVTVLAAWDGKFIEYSVNTPSSVTVPETAHLIKRAVTNAAPLVAVTPPVVAKPPAPRHFEIVLTNSSPPKIAPAAGGPSPVVQSQPEKQEPAAQAAPVPAVGQPVPVAVQPVPVPVQTQPLIASVPVEPAKTPAATGNPPLQEASPKPEATPMAVPSRSAPETAEPPVIVATAPPVQVSPAPVPAAHPAPPPPMVETAVAMPSPEDHIALLVIAFSLLVIAVVLVIFLVRRSRVTPSLISQSMDRPR